MKKIIFSIIAFLVISIILFILAIIITPKSKNYFSLNISSQENIESIEVDYGGVIRRFENPNKSVSYSEKTQSNSYINVKAVKANGVELKKDIDYVTSSNLFDDEYVFTFLDRKILFDINNKSDSLNEFFVTMGGYVIIEMF